MKTDLVSDLKKGDITTTQIILGILLIFSLFFFEIILPLMLTLKYSIWWLFLYVPAIVDLIKVLYEIKQKKSKENKAEQE